MEVAMNVVERETDNHAGDVRVPGKRATSPISFADFLLDILRRSPERPSKSPKPRKMKRKK